MITLRVPHQLQTTDKGGGCFKEYAVLYYTVAFMHIVSNLERHRNCCGGDILKLFY